MVKVNKNKTQYIDFLKNGLNGVMDKNKLRINFWENVNFIPTKQKIRGSILNSFRKKISRTDIFRFNFI